jgi:hypothetical protein
MVIIHLYCSSLSTSDARMCCIYEWMEHKCCTPCECECVSYCKWMWMRQFVHVKCEAPLFWCGVRQFLKCGVRQFVKCERWKVPSIDLLRYYIKGHGVLMISHSTPLPLFSIPSLLLFSTEPCCSPLPLFFHPIPAAVLLHPSASTSICEWSRSKKY